MQLKLWGRSDAGWFEQREARKGIRRLLLAEIRRPPNKVCRHCGRRHGLNRDVREAVAAMTRQLLFGRVRGRALVKIRQDGRIVGQGKRHTAVGTMHQRNKQAERKQEHQRQSANPTSD
jgi:hypothetical protein